MSDFSILDFIPFGASRAVSRGFLATACHVSDRQVREMIRAASTPEHPIAWCKDGYFRPTEKDYEMVSAYYRQESARQRSVGENCKTMMLWLNAHSRCADITPYGKQMSIADYM